MDGVPLRKLAMAVLILAAFDARPADRVPSRWRAPKDIRTQLRVDAQQWLRGEQGRDELVQRDMLCALAEINPETVAASAGRKK